MPLSDKEYEQLKNLLMSQNAESIILGMRIAYANELTECKLKECFCNAPYFPLYLAQASGKNRYTSAFAIAHKHA